MTRRSSFGKPKWTTLNYKSHHIRRWHLNNPWCQPLLTLNYAAVMIQKVVRGHATRHQTLKNVIYKRPKEASVTRNQLDKYLSRLDYYKITKKPRPDWIDDGYSSWCAVTIQSFWRMRLCNQRYEVTLNLEKSRIYGISIRLKATLDIDFYVLGTCGVG